MATRTDARRAVVSILFAQDCGNPDAVKLQDAFFEEQKIRNKQREFAKTLLSGAVENLDAIDDIIKAKLSAEWSIERIGRVEKAVLRLGTYEIKYTDVDLPIIINEALNITKEIAADESPNFINGILDAIKSERI
jgi:N utilization substance protein B